MPNSPPPPIKPIFSSKRRGIVENIAARRYRLLRITAAFCLLIGLVLAAHRAAQVDGWMREVVVVGPSMQPTLWGPSQRFSCSCCGAAIRFSTLTAPPATITCWNCGHAQPATDAINLPGDRVTIDRAAYHWQPLGIPLWQTPPQRGDLVAVSQLPTASDPAASDPVGGAERLQVKRILAVPGDRLSLRGNELRINHRSVLDSLPEPPAGITVHTQSLGRVSAFDANPEPSDPALRWRWTVAPDDPPEPWLVYHHVSVHDQRPDAIRDDYPGNVGVVRRMNPVERFGVTLDVELDRGTRLKVVCWQSAGPRCYVGNFAAGRHHLDFSPQSQQAPARRVPAQHPPTQWREVACDGAPSVDAQRPLAIAGLDPSARQTTQLTVTRQLHWFVDAADQLQWPSTALTLPPGRYFIAGDNQPISIDSRAAPEGIDIHQIVGKVAAR